MTDRGTRRRGIDPETGNPRNWVRIYTFVGTVVLLAAAAWLTKQAITSPEHHAYYVTMAVVWGLLAGGALFLVVAVERRIRRTRGTSSGR